MTSDKEGVHAQRQAQKSQNERKGRDLQDNDMVTK